MLKRIIALLVLSGFIAGCNTMSGVGRDIERGGEKLQNSADKTKEKM
jgi:entericidin B